MAIHFSRFMLLDKVIAIWNIFDSQFIHIRAGQLWEVIAQCNILFPPDDQSWSFDFRNGLRSD